MRAGQWLEAHRIGGGGFSNEIQDWLGIYSRSNQLRDGCLRHRVGPHIGRSSVPLPELAASLLIAADIKNAAAPRAADQKNRTAAHTAICTRLTPLTPATQFPAPAASVMTPVTTPPPTNHHSPPPLCAHGIRFGTFGQRQRPRFVIGVLLSRSWVIWSLRARSFSRSSARQASP